MLKIYCGNDTAQSRKAFSQAQTDYEADGYEHISITDLTHLKQEIESKASLFSQKVFYSVENGLSKKPQRDMLKPFMDPSDPIILIWEAHVDDRSVKKYFPKATIFAYSFPTTLWTLLDGLYPGNLKSCINALHNLSESQEDIMLLFMIQQRTKELILISEKLPGKVQRAPWQEGKLSSQVVKWKKDRLLQFYSKLNDIEAGIKTGTLPYSIKKALDILFCFYLQ